MRERTLSGDLFLDRSDALLVILDPLPLAPLIAKQVAHLNDGLCDADELGREARRVFALTPLEPTQILAHLTHFVVDLNQDLRGQVARIAVPFLRGHRTENIARVVPSFAMTARSAACLL